MTRIKKYFKLMYIFSIMGLQMLGNLVTMVPIFEKELVEKRNLISKEEILDSLSISKCGPGAFIINMVSFIGYNIDGLCGGIFSTLGFIFYPIIFICIIAFSLDQFLDNVYVQSFFVGASACICVNATKSTISFGKDTLKEKKYILIFIITIIFELFTNISSIAFILIFAILGFISNPKKN